MASYGLGAALALRQRRLARTFDLTGGVLPPGVVLTRPTAATRIAADGLVSASAADVARFDHDPVTLALRGLLIEGAATNLMLQSDALDAAPWGTPGGGAAVAANVAAAPTGVATADKLIETATTGQHYLRQTVTGEAAAGVPYMLSFHAKPVERSVMVIRISGATIFAQAQVDVASGAVSASAGSATITNAGGGWSRVAVGGMGDATVLDCRVFLVNGTSSYAGDGVSGVLIHGMQMETGVAATSPIATVGTTASRAADLVSLNWGALGVPDGAATVRYAFDDGSVQDVATMVAGGVATIPPTLARPRLRSATLN